MLTLGASEAKTHFSYLLDRVKRGQGVLITRHGKAVAHLIPAAAVDRAQVDEAIARLKSLRAGGTLGGLSWRELRDEGRR